MLNSYHDFVSKVKKNPLHITGGREKRDEPGDYGGVAQRVDLERQRALHRN